MSLNKTFLLGHLGKDPELRFSKTDSLAICTLSLATNYGHRVNGEWREETEWHRVVVFGKQAERCAEYLKKGREVLIEGRNHTRKYSDQAGNPRSVTEVIASRVQFVGDAKNKSKGPEPQADIPPVSELAELGGSVSLEEAELAFEEVANA